MSGLFDRLIDPQGDDNEERSGGLTPLDIADLPAPQRRIMLALLRDKDAATKGITQEALAEKLEHPDHLVDTLDELEHNGWITVHGTAPDQRYKPALKPKRPRSKSGGLWSSLSGRLDDDSDSSDSAPPTNTPPHPPSDDSSDQDKRPHRPSFPDISKW